eukprot:353794-Chlamydomonas_euryale.AAC.5
MNARRPLAGVTNDPTELRKRCSCGRAGRRAGVTPRLVIGMRQIERRAFPRHSSRRRAQRDFIGATRLHCS